MKKENTKKNTCRDTTIKQYTVGAWRLEKNNKSKVSNVQEDKSNLQILKQLPQIKKAEQRQLIWYEATVQNVRGMKHHKNYELLLTLSLEMKAIITSNDGAMIVKMEMRIIVMLHRKRSKNGGIFQDLYL